MDCGYIHTVPELYAIAQACWKYLKHSSTALFVLLLSIDSAGALSASTINKNSSRLYDLLYNTVTLANDTPYCDT